MGEEGHPAGAPALADPVQRGVEILCLITQSHAVDEFAEGGPDRPLPWRGNGPLADQSSDPSGKLPRLPACRQAVQRPQALMGSARDLQPGFRLSPLPPGLGQRGLMRIPGRLRPAPRLLPLGMRPGGCLRALR